VCFQRADGGACWGRVKDQGLITKRDWSVRGPGEFVECEVLILTDRYVRYQRNRDLHKFRMFFPDVLADPHMRKPVEITGTDSSGNPTGFNQNAEFFFEVRFVPGDSTLRLEEINEEKDIITDVTELLEIVDEKTLFEALLASRTLEEAQEDAKHKEVVPAQNKIFTKGYVGTDGKTIIGRSSTITDGGSGAFGVTAIEIGLRHLIRENPDFDAKAKALLEERFGKKVDIPNKGKDNE